MCLKMDSFAVGFLSAILNVSDRSPKRSEDSRVLQRLPPAEGSVSAREAALPPALGYCARRPPTPLGSAVVSHARKMMDIEAAPVRTSAPLLGATSVETPAWRRPASRLGVDLWNRRAVPRRRGGGRR